MEKTTKPGLLSERWDKVLLESAERAEQVIEEHRTHAVSSRSVAEVASSFERTPAPEGLKELVRGGATISELVTELARRENVTKLEKTTPLEEEQAPTEEEERCATWLSALRGLSDDAELDSLKAAMLTGDPLTGEGALLAGDSEEPGEETKEAETTTAEVEEAEEEAATPEVEEAEKEEATPAAEDEAAVAAASEEEEASAIVVRMPPKEQEEEEADGGAAALAVSAAAGALESCRVACRECKEALLVCDAVIAAAVVSTLDDDFLTLRVRDKKNESGGSSFYRLGRGQKLQRVILAHARARDVPARTLALEYHGRKIDSLNATAESFRMKNLDELICVAEQRRPSFFQRVFLKKQDDAEAPAPPPEQVDVPEEAAVLDDGHSIVTVHDTSSGDSSLYSIKRSSEVGVVLEAHAKKLGLGLDGVAFTQGGRALTPTKTLADLGNNTRIDARALPTQRLPFQVPRIRPP